MMGGSVVVARPEAPRELVLLFHGVGSTAANLVPLAQFIAAQRPHAMVVSVEGPLPASLGGGRQWFSVAGVTEANRPGRIAAALEAFQDAVRQWQAEAGLAPADTTLIGFSQGAIMSLESTQAMELAHRVVAIAGRFAQPPRRAPSGVKCRFVHGENDPVIEPRFSVEAAEALRTLGAEVKVTLVPGLGHGIDERVAQSVLDAFS